MAFGLYLLDYIHDPPSMTQVFLLQAHPHRPWPFSKLLSPMTHKPSLGLLSPCCLVLQVMGYNFFKSKTTTCSNWAAHSLTLHQIKYAALDVFVTGQVRGGGPGGGSFVGAWMCM